eukprot:TRINITY_DN24899_c0_g1_i1.p1 TRINITY_DN24899_c0_g1~~TRINITY_DN24899_c0_g1_i1.p1  ORF type:complete len:534 (+),score=89.90 TRINITY_DN24899_c0_g1_i1:31-1602(+)
MVPEESAVLIAAAAALAKAARFTGDIRDLAPPGHEAALTSALPISASHTGGPEMDGTKHSIERGVKFTPPENRVVPPPKKKAPGNQIVVKLPAATTTTLESPHSPCSSTGMASSPADGNYKTKLCWEFEGGSCPRGDACTFAHGASQLRSWGSGLQSNQSSADWDLDESWEAWEPKDTAIPAEAFTLFLDELSMPQRPNVHADRSDRELFLDVLPANPKETLREFGQVDDVYAIPGKACGYVRFTTHAAAAACVAKTPGASWSESERAKSSHIERDGKSGYVYPKPLLELWLGARQDGSPSLRLVQHVQDLTWNSGVDQLRLVTGSMQGSRLQLVRFMGKFYEEGQLPELKWRLERLLAEAHAELNKLTFKDRTRDILVHGLPPMWTLQELEQLFKHYGGLDCVRILEGFVQVSFVDSASAESAVEALSNDEQLKGEVRCELLTSAVQTDLVTNGSNGKALPMQRTPKAKPTQSPFKARPTQAPKAGTPAAPEQMSCPTSSAQESPLKKARPVQAPFLRNADQ